MGGESQFRVCDLPPVALADTPEVTPPVTGQVTGQVQKLLKVCDGEFSRSELQLKLSLKHRDNFMDAYLKPALKAGFIEMTIPNKPRSSKQKYRLAEKIFQLAKKFCQWGLNGYEVIRDNRLKVIKLSIIEQFGNETEFGTKTKALGIFDFRAFLNIAMLITESERARILQKTILDIAIYTINQRTGGGAKYINQRYEEFLISIFQEEDYRKKFTEYLFRRRAMTLPTGVEVDTLKHQG